MLVCEVRQGVCTWAMLMQRSTQTMLAPLGLILFLLVVGGRCEDAVAANVGHHTMSRIAKLLSPSECHQLQKWLALSNKELEEQELEQPSEENNANRQDLNGPMGCLESLNSWLRTAGEMETWDWLVHGLRQIGRPDIAQELGKNLNQDRSLELQRSLEEYSRSVQHFTHSLLLEGKRRSWARGRRAPDGYLGDLRFERRLPPPYTRSLLGWVNPLLFGILGGFLTSFLFAMVTLYFSCGTLGI